MSNSVNPANAASEIAALGKAVAGSQLGRYCKPDTYLAEDGTVRPMVKSPTLPWTGVSPAAIFDVYTKIVEYAQAGNEAIAMCERPGELERLKAIKAARLSKAAEKTEAKLASKAAPVETDRAAQINAELAALQGRS